MLGAAGGSYATPKRHQFSTSWRYFKSDKHYVGSDYQEERTEGKSQFINRMHMLEFSYRYTFNDRWSLSAAVPMLDFNRNQPLRGPPPERPVIDRFETNAKGLGDITVTAKRWMLRPDTHPYGNFSLGVGIKLPSGSEGVRDYRWTLVDGVPVKNPNQQPVDQSIQLGDGGVGWIGDIQWFQGVADGRLTFYAGYTYMISPKEESKSGHSASDQYLGRLGAVVTGPKWKGFAFGLGGRIEGVPWDDLVRGNEGSRRPGYSISIEPSLSLRRGNHTFLLAVPKMQYANRTRNEGDRDNDRHGDAAFARYSVSVGYSYRWGAPPEPRSYEPKARRDAPRDEAVAELADPAPQPLETAAALPPCPTRSWILDELPPGVIDRSF